MEPDVKIEEILKVMNNQKRSKLHNFDTNNWLRKRFSDKTKLRYLYFPQEKIQHECLTEIFNFLSKDDGKHLEKKQFEQMFSELSLNVKKKDVAKLFKTIDQDRDTVINFQEFKKCTLTPHPTQTKIMKHLKKSSLPQNLSHSSFAPLSMLHPHSPPPSLPTASPYFSSPYIPLSFSSLITHVSYKRLRNQLLKQVNDGTLDINKRAEQFLKLFALHNAYRNDLENSETKKVKEKINLKLLTKNDPTFSDSHLSKSNNMSTLNYSILEDNASRIFKIHDLRANAKEAYDFYLKKKGQNKVYGGEGGEGDEIRGGEGEEGGARKDGRGRKGEIGRGERGGGGKRGKERVQEERKDEYEVEYGSEWVNGREERVEEEDEEERETREEEGKRGKKLESESSYLNFKEISKTIEAELTSSFENLKKNGLIFGPERRCEGRVGVFPHNIKKMSNIMNDSLKKSFGSSSSRFFKKIAIFENEIKKRGEKRIHLPQINLKTS